MNLEIGPYFEQNQNRLDSVSDIEYQWAEALDRCRTHIQLRLKKRTEFGAHTEARLGEEPIHYYTAFAYDAILSGRWEWKEAYTLSEQMCRIADSVISTEVEKVQSKSGQAAPKIVSYDDMETQLYEQDPLPAKFDAMDQLIIDQKIMAIENAIKGDVECEFFWDCVKEGMKRAEIAAVMEKSPKQLDKLREKFIKKIKGSPYFESV